MNKKGIIYLSISIMFVLVLITIFLTKVEMTGVKSAEKYRIVIVNEFINSLHSDVERAAYISSFRAFIGLEEYVSSKGEYINNVDEAFAAIFYNGTYNGVTIEIMEDSTFSDYASRLNLQLQNLDVVLNFEVLDVKFFQTSPWFVNLNLTTSIELLDNKLPISWNYNKTFTLSIPIENLKDPVYSVNTSGKIQNFITPTNISYDDFIIGNDTSNLLKHINSSEYKASDKAPSFMMRFEGNFSASPYGIESIIYLPLFQSQDGLLSYTNRSLIDYVYFGTKNHSYVCYKDDLPHWFKINDDQIEDYELDELNQTSC